MFRHLSRARVRSARPLAVAAIAVAGAAVSGLTAPSTAHAGLTINLQFPGGATSMLIGGDQTNTSIPVQVWATVTGANTVSATNLDGIQYAYYNILNSNSAGTFIPGNVSSAALNTTLGFNGLGSQVGSVNNVSGGVVLGSTTLATSIAKPRAANDVFSNNSSGTANVVINGNSASFLMETVNFTPTAFSQRTKTTFTVAIPTAAQLASGGPLAEANWFQDSTSTNGGVNGMPGPLSSNFSGNASAGTQVVIQDTLAGDANLDGTVNFSDLSAVLTHFGATDTKFADGNFNYSVNGDTTIDFSDLSTVLTAFGATLGNVTPSFAAASPALLADPQATAALEAVGITPVSAVPEPASLAAVALVASATLSRRRRM